MTAKEKFTPPETIGAIHHNGQVVASVAQRLTQIARAMDTLGMHEPADELFIMAEELEASHKAVSGAYGADLNRQIDASKRETAETLKLVLERARP